MAKNYVYVPNDIILQIFSSLPKTSLVRFKCVCKSWSSIIDDSLYNGALLIINLPLKYDAAVADSKYYTLSILHRGDDGVLRAGTSSMPGFLPEGQEFVLHSSGFGLLCYASVPPDETSIIGRSVYVCNPLTKEVMKVPDDSSPSVASSFGLGHDACTNTYKIVHIFRKSFHHRSRWYAEIHDLGTTTWRKINAKPKYCPDVDRRPFIANEDLHWFRTEEEYGDAWIISFDTRKERFYQIRRPEISEKFQLVELNGKLAMFAREWRPIRYVGYCGYVWTLEGKEWDVEYRINNTGSIDCWDARIEIMGTRNDGYDQETWKNGKRLRTWSDWNKDEILFKHKTRGFFNYEVSGCRFEQVHIPSRLRDKDYSTGFVGFKGSLLSLASLKKLENQIP